MKNLFKIFLFLLTISIQAQDYQTNLEEAQKLAIEENKNIVLIFSGSDWCAPCIKLDRNVFQTNEFKKYASENWIVLKIDFPRKKANQLPENQMQNNRKLAEKYNKEGSFPLVVLLTKDLKTLGKTGFKNCNATEYINILNQFEKK